MDQTGPIECPNCGSVSTPESKICSECNFHYADVPTRGDSVRRARHARGIGLIAVGLLLALTFLGLAFGLGLALGQAVVIGPLLAVAIGLFVKGAADLR
jgi:hypothetical protein